MIGKSSLTTALFRIVEAQSGHIEIDGYNTSLMGLDDLRRVSLLFFPRLRTSDVCGRRENRPALEDPGLKHAEHKRKIRWVLEDPFSWMLSTRKGSTPAHMDVERDREKVAVF